MLFMAINNSTIFPRELNLKDFKGSAFLFGPRMTGKTALLKKITNAKYFDLLDRDLEITLRGNPRIFLEELKTLPKKSRVIVDEIQKIPSLLDYVQIGIEELKLNFFLSGSSARKLKRGSANLLGGRASDLKLHPLTSKEIAKSFNIQRAMIFGTLPRIESLILDGENKAAVRLLKSYYTTYLKEEIQAEAIVRHLDSFQRFLNVAAQSNAQMIEYANISRECSVPMETVKGYYQVLEDTLIGNFVWPWDRSERKKARPKFYFFDCGVLRAIQNLAGVASVPSEEGFLFETWFLNELIKIRDYEEKQLRISLWREGDWEIDFLIEDGRGPIMAFECKSSKQIKNTPSLNTFRDRFPKVPLIICSLVDTSKRKLENGAVIYPWNDAIQAFRSL